MKINKEDLKSYVHIPDSLLQPNSYVMLLGGIGLAGIVILLLIIAVLLVRKFGKSDKVKEAAQKIKNMLFWGFLIRYLQTAFLNLTLGAIIGL
jgi:hypothetical protein